MVLVQMRMDCKIYNIKSHGFKLLVSIQMKHAQEVKFCHFIPTPTVKQSMGSQKNNNAGNGGGGNIHIIEKKSQVLYEHMKKFACI